MIRLILALFLLTAPANANCRHALVLALDVSGSVNSDEYRLQVEGLAYALNSPRVQDAILSDPSGHVSIAVFEWSNYYYQSMVQDWHDLRTRADIIALAARIKAHKKSAFTNKTAIGAALLYAEALLADKPDCVRHTIDVSGDGPNNLGPTPKEIFDRARFENIEVNGLVIAAATGLGGKFSPSDEDKAQDLLRYFETDVIHGPNAFALLARSYPDYARAMEEKIIRELRPNLFSMLR